MPVEPAQAVTADALRHWLTQRVREYIPSDAVDVQTGVPLQNYGLDSVYVLTLCGDIEDYLEIEVEATILWDYPTIDALAEALMGLLPKP
ncbi:acyl carrier protein [Streptomyces sp. MB09-02B]|uniref:acyl carrier protein n=1 Tax=Streptomyces sp. MB09-02B TaxID=3028667 RepID=UPI0029B17B3A|nr:acyl carrier protein [Streptomyces sp. MB09-02B]MDX3638443.1 acyl carrier protein [Streptomyces sp. MB09-02B]